MTAQIPVKAIKSNGVATGMGEYQPGETIDRQYTPLPVRTINSQTGTTYTTVLADGNSATAPGTIIQASNAAAITHMIPANASVPYEVGAELYFTQAGAGQLTLTGASGVTLNTGSSLKTRAQGSTIGLYKSDTDTWYTFGDLA